MVRRWPLAPMDATIGGLTALVSLIAVGLLAYGVVIGELALAASALALVGVGVLVWALLRPTAFELTEDELCIVFPTWTRRIPRSDIASVREVDGEAFKQTYRYGLRIGAGGLFGGFGWLYTARGLLEFWISRTEPFVVVEREQGRDLLITPANPASFVDALRE
ncbi:MAG: hypothetical protein EP330_02055 [Deltaproteobacteria bacterium]|nr:MAG: hypothetical protein EP330_02055 [Deltaproteobacteria bacterium]